MRRVLRRFHLWLGVSVGLYLLLMGVTGALLVFLEPIDRASDPVRFPRRVGAVNPAGLDIAWQKVRETYPHEKLQRVYFAEGETVTLLTAAGTWGPGEMLKEFHADPATGTLLAPPRPRYGAFYNFVFYLHMDVLAVSWRETAKWLSGWGALLSLILLTSGLFLWLPRRKNQIVARLSVKIEASISRRLFDWHNVFGVYSATMLLVLCATGLYYQWKATIEPLVYVVTGTPVSPKSGVKVEKSAQLTVSLADIYNAGIRTYPEAAIEQIQLPLKLGDAVRVRKRAANSGVVQVFLHPTTGQIVQVSDGVPKNRAEAALQWVQPLHFGTWGERWGAGVGNGIKVLYVLAGLAPIGLFVTGIWKWQRTRQTQTQNAAKRQNRSSHKVAWEIATERR